MNKKTAKFIFYTSIVLIAVFISTFAFAKRGSFFEKGLGQKKAEKKIQIQTKDQKEIFYLQTYLKNEKEDKYLVKKTLLKTKIFKLSGFEQNVELCPTATIEQDKRQLFCFTGDVGVHSQNLEIISLANGKMTAAIIAGKGGEKSANLISDVPRFELGTENGQARLSADLRDYEKDPINSINRQVFMWTGDGFYFDKEVEVTYH